MSSDPIPRDEPHHQPLRLADDLTALAARVTALEGGGTEPVDEYPAYVQPTGAHDAYHKGDKISFGGKHYVCIAPDGAACVWDPDTYPAYWQEVT